MTVCVNCHLQHYMSFILEENMRKITQVAVKPESTIKRYNYSTITVTHLK
jgi:hypothetical protein